MNMHWLTYLVPRVVVKTGSPYNREIRVLMESGKYKLLVNGARESGAYIEGLWRTAFRSFAMTSSTGVKNILVFGIAGGTVIHLLAKLYPAAAITGVDIDAVMIGIGEKYFGLSKVPHLTCVCIDAQEYVKTYKGVGFDLVIIDVFIGPDIPDFVLSEDFQKKVRRMMRKNGSLVINYLREPGYEKKAMELSDLLGSIYTKVVSVDTHNNRFFLANSL